MRTDLPQGTGYVAMDPAYRALGAPEPPISGAVTIPIDRLRGPVQGGGMGTIAIQGDVLQALETVLGPERAAQMEQQIRSMITAAIQATEQAQELGPVPEGEAVGTGSVRL